MKTGKIIKSADSNISAEDLALINKYTRRELNSDELYVFSVVLCDNDIDRDFERFTVESLFSLEKLFVGKTGIFDHNASAKHQTARIFECKVESVDGQKTRTGDDYFRLVARAYIPKSEKNSDIILSLDSGITKEVSVGCAVKQTLCSICGCDIHSPACHHTKGSEYNGELCYGELSGVYDAYEFSFVAIPAQKNAGVIKAFSHNKKENCNMKDLLSALREGKELSLKSHQCMGLSEYIKELESLASDGRAYKAQLQKNVTKAMSIAQSALDMQTIKGIVEKLSISELESLSDAYYKKSAQSAQLTVQLGCDKKNDTDNKADKNNQFTI